MTQTGWHREDIKAAIRKTGSTLTSLSRQHGYEASAVHKTLGQQWPAVERIIADFLDIPAQNLWPDRYHADGTPRILRKRARPVTAKEG